MFNQWHWHFTLWVIAGLIGQLLFAGRFLIQWISSERKKESHIPIGSALFPVTSENPFLPANNNM